MSNSQDFEQKAETADPTELADFWRVPLSLKIVAFLYIVIGALSITEMVLQLAVFDGMYVDIFGLLSIFIGFGLLRWRETWRRWAVGFCWLFFVTAFLMIAMSVWHLASESTRDMKVRIGPWEGGHGGAIAVALLIGAFFYWQIRVLRRPDILHRFKMSRLERFDARRAKSWAQPFGRWRFSLGSLFLLLTVAAFVLLRLTADDVLYESHHASNMSTNGSVLREVEYGVQTSRFFSRPDRLIYAVLSTNESNSTSNIRLWSRHESADAWLELPDGSEIHLPSDTQLYEIVDGELRTREERVTKAEFDDFLNSDPTDWSLDALVKHAKQMRATESANQP